MSTAGGASVGCRMSERTVPLAGSARTSPLLASSVLLTHPRPLQPFGSFPLNVTPPGRRGSEPHGDHLF
ncbi:hypothetical protein CAAN1_03S07580 [[Candida] anglica]|uniref:Uncharacterized protein n=1 Tax=[Candida] anglica TaxID=148631 RepID=A0ABP0EJL2_9ASCO